jgi:acyl carrier protein
MGLDTVELVMAVEQWFEISIPDAVAETLFTVGDLHGFIISELSRSGRFGGDSSRVYEQLRDSIVRQLGVSADQVVPTARFDQDLRAD